MRMSEKQSNNPIPVVDVIIQQDSEVLFAKRKKEPFKGYLGLPGGFVNIGETIEEAARREVKEETSLDIELTDILGVYSDPQRDPRGHIMSTVFIGWIPSNDIHIRISDSDEHVILLTRISSLYILKRFDRQTT